MSKKDAILDLIQRGDAEMRRYANVLTGAERLEVGTPDLWAPKDILAHMTAWKLHNAEIIAAGRRGEPPPAELDDFDAVNAGIFEQYRHSPWDEILALLDRAQSEMLAQVQKLTEDDLSDLERFPSTEGRQLWRRIAANSYQHPLAHLVQCHILRGDREYASRMAEDEARLVAALDDDPTLQGTALYNLACHYALMGEKDKAYEKLVQSLRLYPALKKGAPQDTDLVSLHGEEQFKSLVN
jgi:tetratricopeptide (TPR) repeat protein